MCIRDRCYSVELDSAARATSSALYPEVVHSGECDVSEFEVDMLPDGVDWFAVTGAPPCQASSRSPTWSTSNYKSMQGVLQALRALNPDIHTLIEAMVPRGSIAGIRS